MLVIRRRYWDRMNMFWTAHRKRSVSKVVGLPPNKKKTVPAMMIAIKFI
jgi:hypothetical protein